VHAGDAQQDKWAKFDTVRDHFTSVKDRRGSGFYV
jgi:hypothetical protein